MKKNVNLKASSPAGLPVPAKPRKHGPDRDKVQLTVRLQKDLMEEAYALTKQTDRRITDMLEQGLIREIKETYNRALMPSAVRFLVENATRAQQEEIWNFLTYLVADELREPSAADRALRRCVGEYFKSFAPLRKEAEEIYRRYGRAEGELKKQAR